MLVAVIMTVVRAQSGTMLIRVLAVPETLSACWSSVLAVIGPELVSRDLRDDVCRCTSPGR